MKTALRQPVFGDIIKYRYHNMWDYSVMLENNTHQLFTKQMVHDLAGEPALVVVWKKDIPVARRWSTVKMHDWYLSTNL